MMDVKIKDILSKFPKQSVAAIYMDGNNFIVRLHRTRDNIFRYDKESGEVKAINIMSEPKIMTKLFSVKPIYGLPIKSVIK